jgi:16S rRNA (uracil1498-N3)-methyltransferase
MEWVVEKAVELGVTRLVPVLTAHTVVQMDRKGPEAFRERWQKIADQALKQCGRLESLEVELPIELERLLTTPLEGMRLWCDEQARDSAGIPSLLGWLKSTVMDSSRSMNLHILIGPEGGWSQNERELFHREGSARLAAVGLGPLVLRAETAAIAALSLAASTFRG